MWDFVAKTELYRGQEGDKNLSSLSAKMTIFRETSSPLQDGCLLCETALFSSLGRRFSTAIIEGNRKLDPLLPLPQVVKSRGAKLRPNQSCSLATFGWWRE